MKGKGSGWPGWSAGLARIALSGHSLLGLSLGALLYLVCLTGTLSVFGQELENWEAPFEERADRLPPDTVQAIVDDIIRDPSVSELRSFIVGFPGAARPYGMLDFFHEDGSWRQAVGADGDLSPPLRTPWTDFLTQLHADLHLPRFGALVVGLLGLFLVSSLLTGLVAHRKILIDAFFVRRSGSPRLFQADVHNRLGAWALPFHLVIAVTGAFLALTPVLVPVGAWYGYGNDIDGVVAVYNGDFPAQVSSPGASPDIPVILERLQGIAPTEAAEFLIVRAPGSAEQAVDVETNVFPHLAYAEVHRFTTEGEYLGSRHYSDGPPGLQFFASSGSLHLGAFDFFPVRIVYGLLGLALTVCCVTGVNIWFRSAVAKGRAVAGMDRLWRSAVWGVPIALGVAALASFVYSGPLAKIFYASMAITLLLGLARIEVDSYDRMLRAVLAAILVVVAATVTLLRGYALTGQNIGVGVALLAAAAVLTWSIPATRSAVSALSVPLRQR